MTLQSPVRAHGFVEFMPAAGGENWRITRARGKRFAVDWAVAGSAPSPAFAAEIEAIVIFPDTPGRVLADSGHVDAPARSVCLIPAGGFTVETAPGAALAIIMPVAGNAPVGAVNDADYSQGEDGHLPLSPAARAIHPGPRVIPADAIKAPADKPRLKILRSAAMSISWIEYEGLRDRSKLSPHSHEDFEQGSLAIHGDYIHHLRTPWGPDANQWREDIHLTAPSASLCVIPPRVIHTTEGLGSGRHLLIDIFAPARADFIAKGWVSNADDYAV
ncbi:MAG: hypothetical protein QM656_09330 [Paracoccaceae bacterium]